MPISVLGIDLASRSWRDNGSCMLTFDYEPKTWLSLRSNCIAWPDELLTAERMAQVLVEFVRENDIAGICLDGPQGWREPNAEERDGVGRLCEYEARCQGKTGEFGKTYPSTQRAWIEFCIKVFEYLRAMGGRMPRKLEGPQPLSKLNDDCFWLTECFPTSIWRTSGLSALPGKERCRRNKIDLVQFRSKLASVYSLPRDESTESTHDDLQALVSTLPIAGLLGGPSTPVARGIDAYTCESGKWVEGIIWDSQPLEIDKISKVDIPNVGTGDTTELEKSFDLENKIVIDDRDDNSEVFFARGIELFECLCRLQCKGESVGVGYAQFVTIVFGIDNFAQLLGRNYATSDTRYVLELAQQITQEAGGRRQIGRDGTSIQAGMDTFIWPTNRPFMRNDSAFRSTPYTKDQWLKIFPDDKRRLFSPQDYLTCFESLRPRPV